MCGRYTITSTSEAIRQLFGLDETPMAAPQRYNIAPSQPVPIIRNHPSGKREYALVRWGMVPHWVKGTKDPALINARSESVLEKPSFRASFQHRRCLVPANGFFEWARTDGRTGEPYYIAPREGHLFAMAGIWDHWQSADGSEFESMAILTVEANDSLKGIHHRMPAVLTPEQWTRWLDCKTVMGQEAREMLHPMPDDFFVAHRISKDVNKVTNDGPGLIRALDDDEMAAEEAVRTKRQADRERAQLRLF